MITSKYHWKNIEKEPDDGFFDLTKKEKITALASKIIYSRGSYMIWTRLLPVFVKQLKIMNKS